jgi:hypothetical protein
LAAEARPDERLANTLIAAEAEGFGYRQESAHAAPPSRMGAASRCG